MSTDGSDLYVLMGGAEGVDAAIGQFYERVMADPVLRPFFDGVAVDKLAAMQHEYFVQALGGPAVYSGGQLSEVHRGRGITTEHLSRFTDHLVDTLVARGLDLDDVHRIVDKIFLVADDVVGGDTEAG
jgi:hemoglobin